VKLGAENRTKVIVLVVLGVGALISVFYMFSSLAPQPQVVATVPAKGNAAQTPRPGTHGPATGIMANSLDPELKLKLLESSEGTRYEGHGRNIFVPGLEEIPNPVGQGLTKPGPPPPPPGPPPPPPINLKFFGFASHPGEPTRVFLAQGETVFIAYEGQIVDRRYKVVHINPASVEIEDVLSNNRQTIPLTQS